jgi:hypothetical protein
MKRICIGVLLTVVLIFSACILPSSGYGEFLDSADYVCATLLAGTYWIWLNKDRSKEAIAYFESEGYVCTSGPDRKIRDEKDHRTEVVKCNENEWGVLYYEDYDEFEWWFEKVTTE